MKYLPVIFSLFITNTLFGETTLTSLPVKVIANNKDTSKPIFFYISGDGGWNKFSTELLQEFSDKGFPVIGLDAKSYFWEKKTPKQAAADVRLLLEKYCKDWKRTKVILAGYSFGADVIPFIYNNLSADCQNKIKYQVLLSPSSKTDFEVHISEMLGYRRKNGMSVIDEINKISSGDLLILSGNEDNDFPEKALTIKNYKSIALAGGHHFDNNLKEVTDRIIAEIKW